MGGVKRTFFIDKFYEFYLLKKDDKRILHYLKTTLKLRNMEQAIINKNSHWTGKQYKLATYPCCLKECQNHIKNNHIIHEIKEIMEL